MKSYLFPFIIIYTMMMVIPPIILAAPDEHVAKKIELRITAAPLIPLGDYGSKNPQLTTAGLADVGYAFEAGITYQTKKNLVLTLGVFVHHNPANNAAASETATIALQRPVTVEAGIWQNYGILGGFYVPLRVGESWQLQPTAMIGAAYCLTPYITSTATDPTPTYSDFTFMYRFGGGLWYQADERISFGVQAMYSSQKPTFKLVTSRFPVYTTQDVAQPISTIQIGFGVGITL